jgi:CheY-like chemotaxis protein
MNHTTVHFLIVDDDEISIMGLQRAMKQLRIVNPVTVARSGQEALGYLRGACDEAQVLPPYIITLDLNMPKMSGFEFLDILREDPALNKAVVFVLSTSDAKSDVDKAYARNIAGYIVKEDAANSFQKALEVLNQYSQLVVLPD